MREEARRLCQDKGGTLIIAEREREKKKSKIQNAGKTAISGGLNNTQLQDKKKG